MSDGAAPQRPLTLGIRLYLAAVIVSGLAFVGVSLREIQVHPPGYQWYMLAALTLVSGSATVTLPSIGISISVSETFVFFSVLLFGPAAGTIMVALDGLVISFWMARRHPEWYRPLFNMAAPALAFWIASHVLFFTARIEPLLNRPSPANVLVLPLAACAVVYFGLNSWLIAFPTAFQRRTPAYRVWRESSLLLSLNYFFGAALALLLVVYTRDVDLTFVGVIIPLLLVSYLTYKTTVGRIEDANEHLQQVNRLYLSTVETLAMAIDAKDQVTHGHIRRVQSLAVNLAKSIGIRNETLIKAIEAAALLHDMGKLAVPEYILNKPGKLTPAEFERMKLHASVGADILSAIDFPYPVVPIVRHHHENWDGTGYPDGLKGTDIPIGARILSVVDCFDALTSDRPYRPKLRDEEALEILSERRGRMYDPLIVDTFTRVHRDIAPPQVESKLSPRALNEIATARRPVSLAPSEPVFDQITASADEMLTLYELSQSLTGQVSVSDACDIITNHLRRLIPGSLYVFYICDPHSGDLKARHAVGDGAEIVRGLRIPLGQRLSGWVGAHRQTIANSDPVLDLGDASRFGTIQLRSCLSTPLHTDADGLTGVLTVYSKELDAFNDDHRRVIEAVSRQIALTLTRAVEFDSLPRRDELTGLPNAGQLEAVVSASMSNADNALFALLFIEVLDLKKISADHGRVAGDRVLRHIVKQVQRGVRVGDVLFRHSSGDFVVLLNGSDGNTATTVAHRIRALITDTPLVLHNGDRLTVSIAIGIARAAFDGQSLAELLMTAQRRATACGVSETSVH